MSCISLDKHSQREYNANMEYTNISEYFGEGRGNQICLARKIGCSQTTLSSIATGRRRPSPKLAAKIEKITGIPLRRLLLPDEEEEGGEGK